MNMENSLSGEKASESRLPDDRHMKKVWFKGGEGVAGDDMIVESDLRPKIFFKEMETMIVLKLLGRNIGYATLHNWISSL
ncbi:hypothetical protein Gogos_003243 [Gossypium gossypioides]|uniref:Uncharacterized protein n=1 Tax=Gossypium gossypioides TaxID=34282 RepID=A0A7J9CLK5_GOSGO|nr:hypothetical protein [Gossypium gossypioides]